MHHFINVDEHLSPPVAHRAYTLREHLSMMEIVFASPLERRMLFASGAFQTARSEQARHIDYLNVFVVSGVYTYVHAGELTTAGLRGHTHREIGD